MHSMFNAFIHMKSATCMPLAVEYFFITWRGETFPGGCSTPAPLYETLNSIGSTPGIIICTCMYVFLHILYLGSRNLNGSAGNCLLIVAISSAHLQQIVGKGSSTSKLYTVLSHNHIVTQTPPPAPSLKSPQCVQASLPPAGPSVVPRK